VRAAICPSLQSQLIQRFWVQAASFLLPVSSSSQVVKRCFCHALSPPPSRSRWRHACRSGADGDVTGEYDELESEHPSKRQKLPGQVGVLMVCQNNLARSPAAAAVFYQKAGAVGTAEQFFVDSCGLGGGNPVS
jgi:hypothetical protein